LLSKPQDAATTAAQQPTFRPPPTGDRCNQFIKESLWSATVMRACPVADGAAAFAICTP
jgi:hypothetical protein